MYRPFLSLLLAASGYFIAGYLGLQLAIPPGFASAVWPASGVALVCLLMLNRLLATIGIGLGSFILNLGVSSQWFDNLSWTACLPAIGIAIGAMLQAYIGDFLFRQLMGRQRIIDSPKELFYFIFVVCLGGCLIAATIGINTLHYLNIISQENFWFSWLTWWAGDAIGVLLFTPLLLTIFSNDKHLSKTRKIQVSFPTAIIFIGIIALFLLSSKHNNARINFEIEERGLHFLQTINKHIEISRNKLISYRAFFNASTYVEQNEFNLFSKLSINDDDVFQAIGWTEIVKAEERQLYESRIQKNGYPEFTFTEIDANGVLSKAKKRETYFPVLYIYPLESNRRAFGLNLAANADRLKALTLAKEKSIGISTAPITLVQEQESQFAYILYLPVFKPSSHSAENETEFIGFVSGVFRVPGLFGKEIERAEMRGDGISITDIDPTGNAISLYNSEEKPVEGIDKMKYLIDFGGRQVQIEYYATNHLQLSLRDWSSWTILTIGFFVAAMLQSFILIITGNAENTKRQVKEKTQDLFIAKKSAEKANAAKSDFTANMSHEIRTPLNAIIGFVNLCLKTTLTPQQHDYLYKSKTASKTLLSLINQTLDYSKIESGKFEIEQKEFHFSELLENLYTLFYSQANEKNLDFRFELPEETPDNLIGDALRLEQVFINLFGNAIKFTERGTITLKIEIDSFENNCADFRFTISDTGIGIPKSLHATLFEPYQQADNSITRKYTGTGLGLTISKQIIELMGGNISLNSEVSLGTEFVICLRITAAKNCRQLSGEELTKAYQSRRMVVNDNSNISTENTEETKKLANVRVLLVEDIEMNRILASELIKEHGAIVTLACDGIEAIAALKSNQVFDVILMDIQMPNMDGYEATKAIRNDPELCHLPIIAMTANALDSDVKKCIESGMNGHIAKPVDEDDMLAKILAQLS